MRFIQFFTFALLLVSGIGQTHESSASRPDPTQDGSSNVEDPGQDYTWVNLGPDGGLIGSVAFHPQNVGEIWASGDDASGLFRSVDNGGSWSAVDTGFKNQATYSLVFDPNDPDRIYAPNYYGHGMLKSVDGGVTWSLTGVGLPFVPYSRAMRVYDLVVDPSVSHRLYAATGDGLYRSEDFGETFHKTVIPFSESGLRAVAMNDETLFIGGINGGVFSTPNNGVFWNEVIPSSYRHVVTDLTLTHHALYIAYDWGIIWKTTDFKNTGLSVVSNPFLPSQTPDCIVSGEPGMWTFIEAVSGTGADDDLLYIGSVANSLFPTHWGFFASLDGGATCQRSTNLDDQSIMSIAANPFAPWEVLVGTIAGGLYKSSNVGWTWIQSDTGIKGASVLSFAQNPHNTGNLVISSDSALASLPGVFESTDGGNSWREVRGESDLLRQLCVFSIDFDPQIEDQVLIGTLAFEKPAQAGIFKSTSGLNGPWTQTLNRNLTFFDFSRDAVNSSLIYAGVIAAYPPANDADRGVYVSLDNGDSWVQKTDGTAMIPVPHPFRSGEALGLGTDVWATTDSFTSRTALGLSVAAPGHVFGAAAFDPGHPEFVLVGTTQGRLFKTSNYNPSGAGTVWSEVENPLKDARVLAVIIQNGSWYVLASTIIVEYSADSTPALIRSQDGGQTWEFLHDGVGPSTLFYRASPDMASDGIFFGMWGNGLLKLLDPP